MAPAGNMGQSEGSIAMRMEASVLSSPRSVPRRGSPTARFVRGAHPTRQSLHTVPTDLRVRRLALNGRGVAALLGVKTGPQIGAALRWLDAQVGDNPELNTREALSALLRFAPRSAWDTERAPVPGIAPPPDEGVTATIGDELADRDARRSTAARYNSS
jgi:hypothetical protein